MADPKMTSHHIPPNRSFNNKTKKMKRYLTSGLLACLAASVMLTAFTLQPAKSNFAGNWVLNESKSDLGEFGGRFIARKMKVEQTADAITIAKTRSGFNGGDDVTSTETLTHDGKVVESTNTTGFGTSKRKASIKWTADEKSFTIENITNFEGGQNGPMEIKGKETWTLSEDGKTLTATTVSNSPQGETTRKAVYDNH
jgi:hypothetical protein